MQMTDDNAHARAVLDGTCYAVLATADADGNPWATPVWFAHDGLDRLYWLSWSGSRHSLLIEQRPGIALTVFDTNAVPNEGTAFIATAQARRCPDDGLPSGSEKKQKTAPWEILHVGDLHSAITQKGMRGVHVVDVQLSSCSEPGSASTYPAVSAIVHGDPGGTSSTKRWPSSIRTYCSVRKPSRST
jgi:hypothetical protein